MKIFFESKKDNLKDEIFSFIRSKLLYNVDYHKWPEKIAEEFSISTNDAESMIKKYRKEVKGIYKKEHKHSIFKKNESLNTDKLLNDKKFIKLCLDSLDYDEPYEICASIKFAIEDKDINSGDEFVD